LADESVGLFPSRFEGFPCAILEQSHAGVPVAAYDAPGAGEPLPRDWLVAPGDADGLARVAVRLLRGLREGAPLVERARAAVARFRIEDVASRTREVYALLCAERGKGRR
jgi:glycosyltransferase involved in cell wall biosynthesis